MLCWLCLEKLSLRLIYTKGSKNIVADARSRLDKIYNLNNINNKVEPTLESLSENLALHKEDVLRHTSFKTIMRFQQKDKSLIEIAKEKFNDYSINQFYHNILCHQGETRTKIIIGQ